MKLYEIPTKIRAALDGIDCDPETGEILQAAALHAISQLHQFRIQLRGNGLHYFFCVSRPGIVDAKYVPHNVTSVP